LPQSRGSTWQPCCRNDNVIVITNRTADIQTITGEVRRLFQVLKAIADGLHQEAGLNASTRAVMEALADRPRTVPEIARQKSVTRQHIQLLVDELAKSDLVELRPNPAHARSPLIALTRKGEALFAAVRRREVPIFDRLAAGIDQRKAAVTVQTLAALRRRAEELLQQQEHK
jgi:DNA-binding MarR family transcriptional regulator